MKIGLIAPMAEEAQPLVTELELAPGRSRPFATFEGRVANSEVVLVQSGPGKVNAAAASQYLASQHRADLLLVAGVAGGLSSQVRVGDTVVATEVVQYDAGLLLPEDFACLHSNYYDTGRLEFCRRIQCDDGIVRKGLESAGRGAPPSNDVERGRVEVLSGTVVTGDQIVANAQVKAYLRDTYGALAVDMESAAIGQVAQMNGQLFAVIRTISDDADASVAIDFSLLISYRDERRTIATKIKRVGAVGAFLVSDPSTVVKAIHLRRNVERAAARTARFLRDLLPLL